MLCLQWIFRWGSLLGDITRATLCRCTWKKTLTAQIGWTIRSFFFFFFFSKVYWFIQEETCSYKVVLKSHCDNGPLKGHGTLSAPVHRCRSTTSKAQPLDLPLLKGRAQLSCRGNWAETWDTFGSSNLIMFFFFCFNNIKPNHTKSIQIYTVQLGLIMFNSFFFSPHGL